MKQSDIRVGHREGGVEKAFALHVKLEIVKDIIYAKPLLPFTREELKSKVVGEGFLVPGLLNTGIDDLYFALESLVKEKQK